MEEYLDLYELFKYYMVDDELLQYVVDELTEMAKNVKTCLQVFVACRESQHKELNSCAQAAKQFHAHSRVNWFKCGQCGAMYPICTLFGVQQIIRDHRIDTRCWCGCTAFTEASVYDYDALSDDVFRALVV
jgi:hypothetical protein